MPKWRAWYSTFATCNGRHPGPNHNASDALQCQALPSFCNRTASSHSIRSEWRPLAQPVRTPPVAKSRNGLFLYAESTQAFPTTEFTKPQLGVTEWPPGSGNKSNNIVLNLGDCAGGGCGTGITLDTESPSANYSRFKWFGADDKNVGEGLLLVGESVGDDAARFRNFRNVSLSDGRYDTHKNVIFDPATRKWVGYVRCKIGAHLRIQCWTESKTENYTSTGWSDPVPTGLNTSSGNYQPDAVSMQFCVSISPMTELLRGMCPVWDRW